MQYFTAGCVVLRPLVVYPFLWIYLFFGFSPILLHIMLNQVAVFVFNNFISVFLKILYTFPFGALIIFIFVAVPIYHFNFKMPSN